MPANDSVLTRIPSASYAVSSSSTVKAGFGNLSSWLRGVTPGGGHESVRQTRRRNINEQLDEDLWSTRVDGPFVLAA